MKMLQIVHRQRGVWVRFSCRKMVWILLKWLWLIQLWLVPSEDQCLNQSLAGLAPWKWPRCQIHSESKACAKLQCMKKAWRKLWSRCVAKSSHNFASWTWTSVFDEFPPVLVPSHRKHFCKSLGTFWPPQDLHFQSANKVFQVGKTWLWMIGCMEWWLLEQWLSKSKSIQWSNWSTCHKPTERGIKQPNCHGHWDAPFQKCKLQQRR